MLVLVNAGERLLERNGRKGDENTPSMILYSEQLLYPDRKINYLADGSSTEQHIWHFASAVSLTSSPSFRPSIRHIRRVFVSIILPIGYSPVRDAHQYQIWIILTIVTQRLQMGHKCTCAHIHRFTLQSVIDVVQPLYWYSVVINRLVLSYQNCVWQIL